MTDYDNTVAKLDNDFLSYNLSKSKWEPKTFNQENPNYLALWQQNNTLISTVTNTLIWMPIFNDVNITQTLIGDFVGIITDYSIWFTWQCLATFALSFTSNNNNFNAYLTLNNDISIFFESIWVDLNGTGSINFIHQFSANDELFFNTD